VNPGGNMSGAPMTYELDGRQFILTPVGGWLYAWALPEPATGLRHPIGQVLEHR